MASVPQTSQECKNFMLSTLAEQEYRSIAAYLEPVYMPLHFVVCERHKPIRHAYFPLTSQHSVLAIMENGASAEIGAVGFEGFSPVDLLLGSDLAAETTVCEIPGEALRMPAARFKEILGGYPSLSRIALRYVQVYLSQVSQSVACNALHNVEQRFARWVLMCHSRVQGNELHLTQEYLASMLGVQRPTVSLVAATFQKAGMIHYSRGVLEVLDRDGLEKASCECYRSIKEQFEQFLGRSIA